MNRRGQTSLEYLLMVTVSMMVVISVMAFMTSTQRAVEQTTDQQLGHLLDYLKGESPTLPGSTIVASAAPAKAEDTVRVQVFEADDPAGVCGDGAISGDEVCDGSNLAGQSCSTRGYSGGQLACKQDCSGFDSGSCFVIF